MWMKVTADIKCTRGDCLHYDTPCDQNPCKRCTCNRKQNFIGRNFLFEQKPVTVKEGDEKCNTKE